MLWGIISNVKAEESRRETGVFVGNNDQIDRRINTTCKDYNQVIAMEKRCTNSFY